MKNFILLLTLLLSSNLFSQPITLTSANNPTPGNTMLTIGCDTAGITEGNSGANQTWNYTTLVRQDSTNLNYVAASSTPYASQFPTSNMASTIDNTNYSYFTTSSSSILTNGFGGPNLVVSNSDPQTFIQYPFTYNSTFTDNFAATYMSTGFTIYRTGTTTVSCDAWGTLNLPIGPFAGAIRVKYIISTTDSSNPGFPFVIRTNLTSYVWFVADKKFPVFEIIYSSINLNGIPQPTSKSVVYSPNNPSIGITQLGTIVPDRFNLNQNYPNPFNPSTKIKFDIAASGRSYNSNVKLTVYDEAGKEIIVLVNENLSPGSYEVDWNAASISSGVYYYNLISENFIETKKMILLK